MNFRRNYSSVIAVYILTIFYIAFVNNKYVTIALVIGLFGITIYLYNNVSKNLNQEKEEKVNTLLNKLDISQKKNEEAYKRFLSLSTTLGSGVFMVDDEGMITFSNKDVENYFDLNFNNKDYKELMEIKSVYNFVNKAYLLEEHITEQIKIEDHYYLLTATPLFEEDLFAGCLILVHDITQIKSAEKFQKQFTADVSHELRTPLAAIKGFSEIMMRDKDMNQETRQEFITTINKESERMEIILNDLMVISRLDRIDYELEFKLLDVSSIIKETHTLLIPKLEDKGLTSLIDVESCEMLLDKVKFSQVIINIIKNAINYTDQGYVNVMGYVDEKEYVIKISDSGIGIKESAKAKIFKRFYRVDKARSRDTGGSGLGLSISKNVVLKHNGTIEVESKENEGSTFIITLPIKK